MSGLEILATKNSSVLNSASRWRFRGPLWAIVCTFPQGSLWRAGPSF